MMNPRLKQNWTVTGNLIHLRQKEGLSQAELGKKLGVKRSSISSWEEYRSRPTIDQLIKLSELFNVTIDELLTRDLRHNKLKIVV